MNPDKPLSPQEELEIRITAMLMGELSAEDAAALQKQIDGDPSLAELHARLRQAMELLREASAIPEQPAPPMPAQLSAEKRERLLAHFKAPAPARSQVIVEPKRNWKKLVPLSLAAGFIVTIGIGLLFPSVSAVKRSAEKSILAAHIPEDVNSFFATPVPSSPRQILSAAEKEEAWRDMNARKLIGLTDAQLREAKMPSEQPGAVRGYVDVTEANGRAANASATQWMFNKPAEPQNPIVGRTVLWTDDASSKLSVNTTAEGVSWDTAARASTVARDAKSVPDSPALNPPADRQLATNTVEFDAARGEETEVMRRSVRFATPAQQPPRSAAPSTPAPAIAANTRSRLYSTTDELKVAQSADPEPAPEAAPAPVALGAAVITDPASTTSLFTRVPDASAMTTPESEGRFGREEKRAGVSAGVPIELTENVKGLAPAPTKPGQSNRGLSKPVTAAFGGRSAEGKESNFGNNVTFNAGDAIALPGIAPTAPMDATTDAKKAYFFEADSDGLADLAGEKITPPSRPAPAAPPLPEMLAKSDFSINGFADGGRMGGGGGTSSGSERTTVGRDVFYKEFTGTTTLDGTASVAAASTAVNGNSQLGLNRGGLAQVKKGKAANENFLSFQVQPTGGAALDGFEKKPVIAEDEVRVMQERARDFGTTAGGVGGIAGENKSNALAWFGQAVAGNKNAPATDLESTVTARGRVVEDYVELALGEKAAEGFDMSGIESKAAGTLSLSTAQPASEEYRRGDRVVEDGAARARNKVASPKRPVIAAKKVAKPTSEAVKQIDQLATFAEPELKQQVKELSDGERVAGEPVETRRLYESVDEFKFAKQAEPELKAEVEKLRKRADEAAVDLAKIRERDSIIDPNPSDYGIAISGVDRNIMVPAEQLNETRAEVTKLKAHMAEIEKLKPEDLKDALGTLGLQDAEVEKLQNAGNSKQLAEKLDTVRANLGVRIQFQEGVVEELEKKMEEAKESSIADQQKEKANNYIEAKTKFLQAKRIYDAAQTKLSTELRKKGEPVEVAKLEKLNRQVTPKDSDDKPAAPKPAEPAPEPQAEVATSANAFSTFSLNVSDVAFKLAAASLEKGQMPELATVRSEEFINAFDYHDPEPAGGAPLACTTERARYPFAQNRDLLRISVKTAAAGRQPGRALNIVLLLDNSGSMERADRVRILHEALRVLATQLQPQDKLSVVTFARTPRLWADGVAGDQAAATCARVGEITPQGGTNIAAALDLGYATARKHFQPGSINRVVMLTDGAANLGDVNPDALKQKVETQRKQGIALDCFGIGWEGYDDTLLEALSRNGDGRYGFINSPGEAATEFAAQLAGALRVAASDVKVQVEWNPRRVTAYRQIGYAKHQLKKEQFRDNTVDAAEIGAAESGNALYACEVNPRGEGDLATVRVRFKVPGTSDYREHEWTVPFTREAPPLEQASPALRLAGTASAFSEWLVSSQYATEVTPDRLLSLLNGVPATFGADPRPQKLEWMIRQAKSVSGR